MSHVKPEQGSRRMKTANMWTKAIIVYIETPTLEMIDNE